MTKAKVLIWDLETAGPNAFYADQGYTMCFGYKWAGSKETYCIKISDFKTRFNKDTSDDYEVMKNGLEIMNQADYSIAHFGKKFDWRYFKGRCLVNGLLAPSPVKVIDTCLIAWENFAFKKNGLGPLARLLGCKHKKGESGFPEKWRKVGQKPSVSIPVIEEISEYNKLDVLTLEDVALKMRAYWPDFTNVRDSLVNCRVCNSSKVVKQGFKRTRSGTYQQYQCRDCGRWDTSSKKAESI